MRAGELVDVLRSFADNPNDIDLAKGELVVQLADDIFEVRVLEKGGDTYIVDGDQTIRSYDWLVNRIARIPTLADRILNYVPPVDNFVTPSGQILGRPDEASGQVDKQISDAVSAASTALDAQTAGSAYVMYLTSDAGEGKTTLINHLATLQAQRFKARQSDWLLVPIPLGGRAFLRFDDVVIAALVNKFRFQRLYYEAFIQLVRLGVLVPAFDGFEEMFIESSSGDALSALATLITSLKSSGRVVIAARKAYFEYQSFANQAKLFDAIGSHSVMFSRLALDRWSKQHFLEYARLRKRPNAQELYDVVTARLGVDHPMVTRAVLVKRLLDVADATGDVNELAELLGSRPQDYFFQFVNRIVEREASEKWLDKAGETHQPLLSVDEHHELLALIAHEMWVTSSDALKSEVIDVIVDVFCEVLGKSPAVNRQIRERIKQHSLLVNSGLPRNAFSFDHEDFRQYYIGEALGRAMGRAARAEIHAFLGIGTLPRETCDHATNTLLRIAGNIGPSLQLLKELAVAEHPSSFVRENCGTLALWFADSEKVSDAELAEMSFIEDSLKGRRLRGLRFHDCYFFPTSLRHTSLRDCQFSDCRFERLGLTDDFEVANVSFHECEVKSVIHGEMEDQIFDPGNVERILREHGIETVAPPSTSPSGAVDEEIKLVERALRIFLRSTFVNDEIFAIRLGKKASTFQDRVLPRLIKAGVLEEVQYLGSGTQRRFKLSTPLQDLQAALSASNGSFENFMKRFS